MRTEWKNVSAVPRAISCLVKSNLALRSRLRLDYGGRRSRSRLSYGDRSSRSRLGFKSRRSRSRLNLRSRLRFGIKIKVKA
jgi:hypothetical protein